MKTYCERQGFLGLESPYCDWETSRVAIVPIDFVNFGLEKHPNESGYGPSRIIQASKRVRVFGNIFGEDLFRKHGVSTLQVPSNFLPADERTVVKGIFEADKFPIIIASGNASVNPAMDVARDLFGEVSFLRFDSRLNILSPSLGKYSEDSVAFGELIKVVKKILFVGTRSAELEEVEILRQYRGGEKERFEDDRVHVFRMRKNIRRIGFETFLHSMRALIKNSNVWLSFHLSVMDQSVIGLDTTYFEPGGFLYDEVLDIFESIFSNSSIKIVGADFTGVSPTPKGCFPESIPTCYIVAKIISCFIVGIFSKLK